MFYVHHNPPSLRHTLQKMCVSKYRRDSLKLSKKIFWNTIDIKLEGGTFLSKLHFWQKPNPRKKKSPRRSGIFLRPKLCLCLCTQCLLYKEGRAGGPPAPPLLCEFQVFQLRRRGYCRPPPPAMLLKLYLFSLPMEKEMRWRNSIF